MWLAGILHRLPIYTERVFTHKLLQDYSTYYNN